METITSADGAKISWQTTGSGPSLLLVHGTTADHSRWAGISPQFEQHFTVHAMDRRGRGASTDDAQGYDILREAEDVSAVVDAIGGPVDVLGHSYGAVCSLEAALLTDGVRKMVLYEPPLPTDIQMYPTGVPDRMQALIDDGELEAALELFFREVVRMPDHELVEYRELPVWKQRIQLAPTIPRELAIDRSYSFESAKYADLRVPVLLMLGGDSPPIFQRAVETANGAVPGSRVVLLPGQQHIAMDTDPALFVGEVLDFLMD
jgi:pimeloyl-ACP methyl ester carboxylesterase